MNCSCINCGDDINPKRYALGYRTCLLCGEEQAQQRKFTVAPIHKGNYMLITDRKDLVGLNNKGGLVK